ncbi:aldose epimerase [Clostridium sp. P21]|uniref:Aldose epimerase n=1 Tax=Clostridium muellerianum TaxID=2716538 RepID=A0A7Y0EKX5_9CLOT|nr:aldose epimerase [Clostridium muellerianum]NMM65345.1 aldose epimerase [Clostridium muellerianum]
MFKVKEFDDKFKMYRLEDEKNNSWVNICPQRGGIVTSLGINGEEILYLDKDTFYDENKNVRGGNPVLFPLCGQLPDQKYDLDGKEYSMKNHGLARISSWEVINKNTDNCASIKVTFKSNEDTLKSYPFEFELQFEYILKENKLMINQQYINNSDEKMPMSAGFHPYFLAKDKKQISYDVNASEYFDNEDSKLKKYPVEGIDLSNTKELKLLLDHKGNSLSFSMKDLKRKIRFDYSDEFKYIVLWSTPGSEYVCVEPWTSKIGALASGEDLLEVNPKSKIDLTYSITADSLSI